MQNPEELILHCPLCDSENTYDMMSDVRQEAKKYKKKNRIEPGFIRVHDLLCGCTSCDASLLVSFYCDMDDNPPSVLNEIVEVHSGWLLNSYKDLRKKYEQLSKAVAEVISEDNWQHTDDGIEWVNPDEDGHIDLVDHLEAALK
jgi:hypothetical protein